MILAFFLEQPLALLFYLAVIVTGLDLVEEIALTYVLPKWTENVKGLYWVLTRKEKSLLLLLPACLLFV